MASLLHVRTNWLAPLALVAGCLALTPRAHADDKVQVTVLAILATDQNKTIDPKLKPIAEKVRKLEPGLTGFRLARQTGKSLCVKQSFDYKLVENEVVTILVEHGADEEDRVGLKIKPPQLGEISYSCCCGKFFPIVTRYQTKDKERLIIAIMVEPCKK